MGSSAQLSTGTSREAAAPPAPASAGSHIASLYFTSGFLKIMNETGFEDGQILGMRQAMCWLQLNSKGKL